MNCQIGRVSPLSVLLPCCKRWCCLLLQVSEGGRAAVRATVRLSVSLSALASVASGGGKHRREGSGAGITSPRSKASAASGSCRPIFTVRPQHEKLAPWWASK
jgi:hypothetical protein